MNNDMYMKMFLEFYFGFSIMSLFYYFMDIRFNLINLSVCIMIGLFWGYYAPLAVIIMLVISHIINKTKK